MGCDVVHLIARRLQEWGGGGAKINPPSYPTPVREAILLQIESPPLHISDEQQVVVWNA